MSQLWGVVEGFYGKPWDTTQRFELYRLLQSWHLNAYLYAPKDDRKHRAAWRELYDESEVKSLQMLIEECNAKGIQFIYALSPGVDITYSQPAELQTLLQKLQQVQSLGCTSFALLFDDIESSLREADKLVFENSFARAQCYVINETVKALGLNFAEQETGQKKNWFLMCPTEYCTARCPITARKSVYLSELGQHLDTCVDVLWTGPNIISETISVEHIRQIAGILKRKPLLWDNLQANDYDIRRLYLGPFNGRSSELRSEIRGCLLNPNCEYEANYIPLRTLSLYTQTDAYESTPAYQQAVQEWHAYFLTSSQERNLLSVDDLLLVTDCFYLPHSHGERARVLYDLLQSLTTTHSWEWHRLNVSAYTHLFPSFKPTRSALWNEDDTSYTHPLDTEACQLLCHICDRLHGIFEAFTTINHRGVLYALYQYFWGLKEEALILREYVRWLGAGKPGKKFVAADIFAKTYRGGLQADLQSLVSFSQQSSTFEPTVHTTTPQTTSTQSSPLLPYTLTERLQKETPTVSDNYVIRCYQPKDEADIYLTCLRTGNAGQDASHLYTNPTILGQRWVGPYINLQPDLAFVLHDKTLNVAVGYVLSALHTKPFYERMESDWLPSLRRLYPYPESDEGLDATQEMITCLHEVHYVYPKDLEQYPSHLHIDLQPSAQGHKLGFDMMRHLLAALRAKGSKGVFLEMAPTNARAFHFYSKLGFEKIAHTGSENDLILGLKL